MKIFLLIDPPTATQQETKVAIVNGKPRFYKPENVRKAKSLIIKHLLPFKPNTPYNGPISLKVVWRFPKGKFHKDMEYKTTKPDTDNLEKMLKDSMTEVGFWKDDALVVIEHVEKLYTEEPNGIEIEINIIPQIKEVNQK